MTNDELREYVKCAKNPVYFLNTYGYVYDINKKQVDRLSCFKYQEDIIRKYEKFQNNIILKSRQCLPEDTFVDTPDGPRPIQNFKVGDLVYSYNLETNSPEIDTVADAWYSGERQCVKLKLKDSRNVEVGENHPFWIVNKQAWIKAKDLDINDEILDANLGFGDILANENEVKLLAYLITDGCTSKQVKFTNNNIDYLSEFEESAIACFPELELRKSPKENGFDYFPHQKHGVSTLNPIMEWCENKGIANKKTEFKILPEEVFYWDKKSVSLLINRIFAGDGWVSIIKKKKVDNKRLELGLGSPSLVFLEQIKNILKKFEVKGNIFEVKNMKLQQKKFYKLRITHSKSIEKFINEIGIYKKIKPEHLEIIGNRKHDVKNTSLVRKIEKTEIKKCFDISVTKNENFLINGLLVHNTGLSVITAGYIAWKLIFSIDEKILIVANKGDSAVRLLETIRQFLDHIPAFLLPAMRLENNTKKIRFSNGSWVKAVASSKDAGRGEALSMLVLDETAFIEHASDIWMAAGLALSATQGKCIMLSTPNGASGLYHSTWVSSKKGENDFERSEIHWGIHPVFSLGMEKRFDEFGKDFLWSPWYEQQCEKYQYDMVKISQELDLSFEGSAALVVENHILEKYEKDCMDVKPECWYDYKNDDSGFVNSRQTTFIVWDKPVDKTNYIIAADVGRGDGSDYSTIQILDADRLVQVAEYQGKVPPDIFAHIIYKVAKEYNNAFVAIECNSFGLVTSLTLKKHLKYDSNRIYHSKSVKKIYIRHPGFDSVDAESEIPGFQTTMKSRPLVIGSITKHMRNGEVKIRSTRLLDEFKTFVFVGDKAEHSSGYHDDLIIAFGIALFMRETEFDNVFRSREFYKAMLDSMGKTSNSDKFNLNSVTQASRAEQNAQKMQTPTKNDNNDDISWLYGPIKG